MSLEAESGRELNSDDDGESGTGEGASSEGSLWDK